MASNQTGISSAITNQTGSKSACLREILVDVGVILLVWIAAVLLVRPMGEFPLNDDWSWGRTAKDLAEGNGYRPTAWTEMTLFTHAAWGALFCLPQGFSFTALRLSTLAAALLGIGATYGVVRWLSKSRLIAVVGALTLACNPIYFALSNTYMADVPFTVLAILSAFLFSKCLEGGAKWELALATGLAVAATLSRQMGLCLPVAFGITLWLRQGFNARWLGRMIAPTAVCVVVLVAFQYWLKSSGKAPANTMRTERLWAVLNDPVRIPINVAYYGWGMLMYLGWFLGPILALDFARRWRGKVTQESPNLTLRVVMMLFLIVTAAYFVMRRSLMPVHNNILSKEGIGPATLRDVFELKLPHLAAAPMFLWILITVLSLAGAAWLVIRFTGVISELFAKRSFKAWDAGQMRAALFLLCAAVYLVPFLVSGYFDRYLLPVLAFLLACFAIWLKGAAMERINTMPIGVAGLLVFSLALFGILGTHDYLAWNRARWGALNELVAQGVAPTDIDGGFEFNGWHQFGSEGITNIWSSSDAYVSWSASVPYVVAFGRIDGFEAVQTNTYPRWLPPQEGQILILKRK